MKNWLKRLRINRVALVDKGANPDADVVLFKRDMEKNEDEGYGSMEECMAALGDDAKCKALMAAMKRAELEGDPMPDKLRDIQKNEDEGYGSMEECMAALGDDAKCKALMAAMKRAELEGVTKALAEVADLKKRADAAEARTKEAEAKLAKMEDADRLRTFVVKVESFSALPIEPLKFAPILQKAYAGLTEEEQKELDRVLHSASDQIATAKLLSEVGHGGAGVAQEPYDKLEKMANELVQKDGTLTFAKAFAKVCDTPDGKKLYRQYEDERAAAARRER